MKKNMLGVGYYCLVWVGVMTLSIKALVNSTTDHYTCHQDTSTLMCDYDLPDHWNIPDGITEIHITNYNFSTITERKNKFKNAKWEIVKTLDIIGYVLAYNFNNYDFEDLPHLQRFGIHSPGYEETALSAFVGLNDMSYLDFSGCTRLKCKSLFQALANKNNSFHLNYLNLDDVGSQTGAIKLDNVFVNMLGDRNVLHLSIRNTLIVLMDDVQYEAPLELVSVDVVNSFITKLKGKHPFNATKVFKSLKYFNSSRANLGCNQVYTINKGVGCLETILSVETIDVSHICNIPIHLTNVLDLSCFIQLKHLYLRSNTIVRFTPTIVYYSPSMETLDLSWNGMELISPTALNKLAMLIILDLSNNHLFKMEHNYEFEYLFMRLNKLETIYLQNNSLSFLPTNLFKANSELKTIVLSENKLKTIDLNINHLHKLQLLDLQRNKIVYLESFQTLYLQNYLTLNKLAENESFLLDLKNNIFECSCNHIEFLMWISVELQPLYNDTYSCSLENYIVNIDSKTLEKTSNLCYKTSIIVALVLSISMTVIISGLTILVCYRKRIKKQRQTIVNKFLNQLMKGHCDEKYLVFVSFSSDDCQFSNNAVEPALKYHMSEQYEIPERLIVTGDNTFKVGFPILNEIMRCIKASCVVVCLVSQSYCDSQWCQTELREAVEQGKPIILLFLEEIEKRNMLDNLWTLFNRYTRSKLVQRKGKFEPIAGWNNLCDSIVTLASSKYNIDKIVNKRKEKQTETIRFDEDVVFIEM